MKKLNKWLIPLSFTPILTTPIIAAACDKKVVINENVEYETKLGLSISKKAYNQQNITADEVVSKLINLNSWNEIKKVLNKYSIPFNDEEIPSIATYKVSSSTHAHSDGGIIHLDIIRVINNAEETTRFTIAGFKEEIATITLANYHFIPTLKLSISATEFINELKASQNFNDRLNVFKKYYNIEKTNENIATQFDFDFTNISINKGHDENYEITINGYISINESTQEKTNINEVIKLEGFSGA
ncbi:Uncharacterised protein [Metamycoplasma cloacale]|uniref:Uncharacterized protein n=2 Tax=Metamycoplasma cloacale TaxID=92401 RepID=A0A2Z4LLF9_9BACT|nr:hypothetical protein DK849_00680 [Metamycoplasma cloacale]VEU79662.1 Uncharacterised protein [Metamycoplasma cloacale]